MNIHKSILVFIEKSRVITTSELAHFLGISWNTSEKHLLELTLESRISRLKKEGVNLWFLPPKGPLSLSKSDSKILKFIHAQYVVSTSELAGFLKVSWNTAEKYLLELTLEDKVTRLKKAGVNLWLIK